MDNLLKNCPLGSGDRSVCSGSNCQWWDGGDCAVKNISLVLRRIASKID